MTFTIDNDSVDDAFERTPRWNDVDWFRGLALVPFTERPDVPLKLGRHPLFDPWRDQIIETAALEGALLFGDEVDSTHRGGRAGGNQGYIGSPAAPNCGLCGSKLSLCVQLPAPMVAPWLEIDGMLTVAYCFDCHPEADRHYDFKERKYVNGRLGCYISVEEPTHLVEFGEAHEPARALEVELRWSFPNLNYVEGGFDAGACAQMLEWDINPRIDFTDEYMSLVAERDGYRSTHAVQVGDTLSSGEVWRTHLGGYPSWDQDDVTPKCATCDEPMQLLLDFNGNQFLDGALHIFTCTRTDDCKAEAEFAFSAEF